MTRFIFITGGVVSSLGKGLSAASIGLLLQARGFKILLRKLDPYLNIDPGTMSPDQHGEVYVTEDGGETDLDLGHYERFTGVIASKKDNITTGQIYSTIISSERKGHYLGNTVQVIPHVTNIIIDFIQAETENVDFVLCEIGGTVGDIEGLPFLEAIRQMRNKLGMQNSLFIHLTLLPYISTSGELKTKPTQHSVKSLLSIGIQPDILLCRADREISISQKKKISLFCNIPEECVISALDQTIIYSLPIAYYNEELDLKILKFFNMDKGINNPDEELLKLQNIINIKSSPAKNNIKIAFVAKYTKLQDAYKSLIEAVNHASMACNSDVELIYIDADRLNDSNSHELLENVGGIIIPGGFGIRGTEGKIAALKYGREKNIPCFGICFGMQLMAIEIARNIMNINDATSGEFETEGTKIIDIMNNWYKNDDIIKKDINNDNIGGTMRLGAYPCVIDKDSIAGKAYKTTNISERHRHRYEFNSNFRKEFEKFGLKFTGLCPVASLVEIIELPKHKWFVGVQFHPEFKSRPLEPHPLFVSFIKAIVE
jgi:CTP synthase